MGAELDSNDIARRAAGPRPDSASLSLASVSVPFILACRAET